MTMQKDLAFAREALRAGASGYVLKEAARTELVDAVHAAAAGRTYLDPGLGARLAVPAEATAPAALADLTVGTTFAGHRIDAVAGRGGMAVVYRATDPRLDRPVALKVIEPSVARDPVFRARFERECRIAAAIDHPNVVPIFQAGEEGGLLYLTMRYVDGTDLRTLLADQRRLAPVRSVALLAQVAGALDEAHRHGLVHRDVKPGNILIRQRDGEEHAFLTDFGVTKQRAVDTSLTRTGFAIGTADYMAPEQAQGAELDARADIYALGCVLFQTLTGIVPYDRGSDVETMWAHIHEPPPALLDVCPHLPAALGDVIAVSLAKAPHDRQQSAGELARAAHAALQGRDADLRC